MEFPFRAFELNRYKDLDNPPTGEVWPDLESNPDVTNFEGFEITAVDIFKMQKTMSEKSEDVRTKTVKIKRFESIKLAADLVDTSDDDYDDCVLGEEGSVVKEHLMSVKKIE